MVVPESLMWGDDRATRPFVSGTLAVVALSEGNKVTNSYDNDKESEERVTPETSSILDQSVISEDVEEGGLRTSGASASIVGCLRPSSRSFFVSNQHSSPVRKLVSATAT